MMDVRETTKFVTDKAIALIKALHNPTIGAKEFSGGGFGERCDAILFNSFSSFMIETKISRSDFLIDFKKPHRQEGCGVGNYRYYACPNGLIKPEELPPKWGLIYVDIEKKANVQQCQLVTAAASLKIERADGQTMFMIMSEHLPITGMATWFQLEG